MKADIKNKLLFVTGNKKIVLKNWETQLIHIVTAAHQITHSTDFSRTN